MLLETVFMTTSLILHWIKKIRSSNTIKYNKIIESKLSSTSCRFLKSPAAQEACDHLTKVLGTSPLFLKELDLSEDKLGDLDGEKLSALLMDSHSKLEKIK